MDDAREHQAAPAPTGPSHRPPPPRPEFRVEPRHPHVDDAMPRQVTAAMWFWFASFAVLIGIVAATLIDVHDVRGALESALAGESPRTSQRDVADAVSLTLLGCGAAAAVLVVAALIGLQLLRLRRRAGRVTLAVTGALSVAAAFVFWSLLADAADATGGVLQWAPALYAALVTVGVALLFPPPVTQWLRSPRSR